MKWYSEEELKKWKGYSITLPLLEQMEYKETRQCGDCPYWKADRNNWGTCKLKMLRSKYSFTHSYDNCKEGFAR